MHFDVLNVQIPVRIMLNVHVHLSNKYNVGRNFITIPVCVCVCVACVCEREEGSDHAATIKLSPWQKIAVSNEIVFFIKYIH